MDFMRSPFVQACQNSLDLWTGFDPEQPTTVSLSPTPSGRQQGPRIPACPSAAHPLRPDETCPTCHSTMG